MRNSNKIKSEQLGMSHSTASGQLRKLIMFQLIEKAGMNKCHRCGEKMELGNFSIEHIENWLHSENPKELFFDLNNIAFSHTSCNYSVARRPKVEPLSLVDKKGEASGRSKLKNEEVIAIKKLLADGMTYRKIAEMFNIHPSTVGNIATKKNWLHIE